MTNLSRLLLYLCIGFLLSINSYSKVNAQSSPELINYQAVARDGNGDELSGANLDVEFSIIEGSPSSNPVYVEIHTGVITDPFGLFSIQIGSGIPLEGDFSTINWSENTYVKIGIDAGDGIIDIGTMQFVSVPYALYSSRADSANYGADEDADPSNELQELQVNGAELSLSDDASGTFVNLTDYNTDMQQLSIVGADNESATIGLENAADITFSIEDADADSLNELQELQINGSELSLSDDQSGTSVDLMSFNSDDQILTVESADLENVFLGLENVNGISFSIQDADSDPINEIQTISKSGSTVTLSNDGGNFIDEVDDADADASNEFQTISKSGSTVSLSDGGGNFTDEVDDADADASNELQSISKAGSTVTLSNGGGSFNDAVNDLDANPSNELISAMDFNSSTNVLTITESGSDQSSDLSELKDDLNWDQNGQNISNNNTGNVGINEINPSSTFHIMGSTAAKVRVEGPSGTNYALGDETIFIGKPTVGDVEVDLPSAASVPGRIYIIKKGDPNVNNDLKIHANGSDLIEGVSTYILGDISGVYEQVIIVSDGASAWWVISKD